MAELMTAEALTALLTLTALEIVLSIDNIVFISIVAGRLPKHQQDKARRIGIGAALLMRIGMLIGAAWVISLAEPLFSILGLAISWRDIILIVGGLFLLVKGTREIHNEVEGDEEDAAGKVARSFAEAVVQIMILDVIFSVDTVITAVGMTDILAVMVIAISIATGIMLWSSGPIARFVSAHPTVKMLALAFLMLIGVALVADGLHFHIPRGYIYFAVAFSVGVEALNLAASRRRRRKRQRQASGAKS